MNFKKIFVLFAAMIMVLSIVPGISAYEFDNLGSTVVVLNPNSAGSATIRVHFARATKIWYGQYAEDDCDHEENEFLEETEGTTIEVTLEPGMTFAVFAAVDSNNNLDLNGKIGVVLSSPVLVNGFVITDPEIAGGYLTGTFPVDVVTQDLFSEGGDTWASGYVNGIFEKTTRDPVDVNHINNNEGPKSDSEEFECQTIRFNENLGILGFPSVDGDFLPFVSPPTNPFSALDYVGGLTEWPEGLLYRDDPNLAMQLIAEGTASFGTAASTWANNDGEAQAQIRVVSAIGGAILSQGLITGDSGAGQNYATTPLSLGTMGAATSDEDRLLHLALFGGAANVMVKVFVGESCDVEDFMVSMTENDVEIIDLNALAGTNALAYEVRVIGAGNNGPTVGVKAFRTFKDAPVSEARGYNYNMEVNPATGGFTVIGDKNALAISGNNLEATITVFLPNALLMPTNEAELRFHTTESDEDVHSDLDKFCLKEIPIGEINGVEASPRLFASQMWTPSGIVVASIREGTGAGTNEEQLIGWGPAAQVFDSQTPGPYEGPQSTLRVGFSNSDDVSVTVESLEVYTKTKSGSVWIPKAQTLGYLEGPFVIGAGEDVVFEIETSVDVFSLGIPVDIEIISPAFVSGKSNLVVSLG